MRFRPLLFICTLLICAHAQAQILPTFGNSRTGGSGMQFLKIAPDARSLAMGGSNVAVANDLSALYWNPAGITGMDTGRVNLMISNTRYFGDISSNYAAAAMKVGKLSFVGLNIM